MIRQPLDYAVLAWLVLDLLAFGLMVAGFWRLYAQAWRMPNRWQAVWRVTNVRPRRTPGWPDSSAGAELILRGAFIGAVLFSLALVFFLVLFKR